MKASRGGWVGTLAVMTFSYRGITALLGVMMILGMTQDRAWAGKKHVGHDTYAASANVNLIFWPGITVQQSGGNNVASLTNKYDAPNASYWGAPKTASPSPWVQVDLGQTQEINRVNICFYSTDHRASAYRIYAGNDTSLFTAGNEVVNVTNNNAQYVNSTFTPTAARYVRCEMVTGGGNDNNFVIKDVAVYSTDAKLINTGYPISGSGSGGASLTVLSGSWSNQGTLITELRCHDGNFSPHARTFLNSGAAGTVKITFDSSYYVSSCKASLYPSWTTTGNYAPEGVKIELSNDDVTYSTVADVTYTSSSTFVPRPVFTFAPMWAKYAKVTIPAPSHQKIMYRFDFFAERFIPSGTVVTIK